MVKFMAMTAGAILAAALATPTGAARADSSTKAHVTNVGATARCNTGAATTTANDTNCNRPANTARKAGGDPHGSQVQLNPQPLPPSTGERKAGGDPNSKSSTGIIIEGHTTPNAQTGGGATK